MCIELALYYRGRKVPSELTQESLVTFSSEAPEGFPPLVCLCRGVQARSRQTLMQRADGLGPRCPARLCTTRQRLSSAAAALPPRSCSAHRDKVEIRSISCSLAVAAFRSRPRSPFPLARMLSRWLHQPFRFRFWTRTGSGSFSRYRRSVEKSSPWLQHLFSRSAIVPARRLRPAVHQSSLVARAPTLSRTHVHPQLSGASGRVALR